MRQTLENICNEIKPISLSLTSGFALYSIHPTAILLPYVLNGFPRDKRQFLIGDIPYFVGAYLSNSYFEELVNLIR